MSWEERLGKSILFTSPEGREFEAQWIGNTRSKSKKIGQFSPPKRKGTIYQDLNVSSTLYPLTIIFDGDNHDLIASLFFESCNETGIWTVVHPVHGNLSLQLLSVSEKNEPVKNGNYTEIESQWAEPADEDTQISSAELRDQIEEKIRELNASAAAQLESVSDQTTASRIQALKDAAGNTLSIINNQFEKLSDLSTDVARITNSIQRATTSNLANPLISINSLATQIQIASQTPALATSNVQSRVGTYSAAVNSLLGNNPSDPTIEGRNSLAIKELALTSIVATLPRIVTSGDIQTKTEAIELAELFSNLLTLITNDLDAAQEIYQDNILENQYFSQSSSYSDLVLLIGLGIEFLLRSIFDLKTEKRFTIDRNRTPIDIAISEYGGLGDDDENLNLFIVSNNLKGNDIILLPAGREVVVYV